MITYLNHEQNTQEWLAARYGRFTASEFGMFVMRRDAKAKTAFENNIMTKLGEYIDQDDCAPSYEDYNMKRGKLLEQYALAAYESHMESVGQDVLVQKVGLCVHDTLPLGFSADALVRLLASDAQWGLELKCPTAKIQLLRIREKVVPSDYLCQIHGSMFLMNAPHWDFFSWHPKLPAFYIRVYRDSFTEELGQGLMDFGRELLARKQELDAMMA